MLKLRTILLYNYIYYGIIFIAILYTIISINFIPHSSIYDSIEEFTGIITNIKQDSNKITLTIKNKESIIGYIYNNLELDSRSFTIGDTVKIIGEEIILKDNTTIDTFNYKQYLSNKNIFHIISIKEISIIEECSNILYNIKNFFIERSYKLKKSFPYINSLILGDNNYIEDDTLNSYRENGISHLFAISGLHVALFIMILSFIMKKIRIKENARYFIIILFLLFYMFLTNFSMSVMRAGIFTILLTINKLFYFYIKPINILLLTLAIILFINPRAIFDIGLQYSFIISFSLILFQSILQKHNYLITLFYTSIIAFIVSFPITIYNFYQINVLSIIYNLFFVPYLSFIVLPFTIISFIFPFLDKILYFFIIIMENISLLVNKIEISKLIFMKPSIFILIIYYIVIFFCLYMYSKNNKKYILIVLLIIIIHYLIPNFLNKNYYLMFDVGQGDSSLLVLNQHIILIDTGGSIPFNENYNPSRAKNIIIPYLKSQGIKKINSLILTHGDSDHMQDSFYLVNNFKVESVIFNNGEYNNLELELINNLMKKKINYYQNIDKLNIGEYYLYFLNTKVFDNENDNSSVLYLNYNNKKLLLMGDAGINSEKEIINKYDLFNIDILKVGHHGSNTSSHKDFIEQIKPKNCLISVGYNNNFGHPKQSVLDILNECNIQRTDLHGSIKINLN